MPGHPSHDPEPKEPLNTVSLPSSPCVSTHEMPQITLKSHMLVGKRKWRPPGDVCRGWVA